MKIIISNSSSVPIYEQIKSAFIKQILSGDLIVDEALPSIRSLAQDIHISIMTIKKAYDELEREGYIKIVQGKGAYVALINKELAIEHAKKEIEEYIEKAVLIAKEHHISEEEIKALITFIYRSDEE